MRLLALLPLLLLGACVTEPIAPPDSAEPPASVQHTLVSEASELPVTFLPNSAGMNDDMSTALFKFARNSAAGTAHLVLVRGPGAGGPIDGARSSLGVRRAAALERALELGGVGEDRVRAVSGGRSWSVIVYD